MSADKKSDTKETVKSEDEKHEPSFQNSLPRATDPFGSKGGGSDEAGISAAADSGDDAPVRAGRARTRAPGRASDAAADAIAAIARRHGLKSDEPEESAARREPDEHQAARRSAAAARHHAMYDSLVDHEDDLIGLIAYALHKQHKRDWLNAFQAENGRAPREDEVNSFLLGERTANRLRSFREQATTVMASYADSVVADARPQILVEAIEGKIRSSLRWWKQIPAGLAGAVLFVLLVAAIIYVLPYLGMDIGLRFGAPHL